jgi:hypothetical protein
MYDVKFPNDLSKATLTIHGTCFAITDRHLVTAYHNITDSNLKNIGISKFIYTNGSIDPSGFYPVTMLHHHCSEDWAILELNEPSVTMNHLDIFNDQAKLPETDYVMIYQIPVGLIREQSVGKFTCERTKTRIYCFGPLESRKGKVKIQNKFTLGPPTEADLKTEVVTVRTESSVLSGGAPYCLTNGSVLAFHTSSIEEILFPRKCFVHASWIYGELRQHFGFCNPRRIVFHQTTDWSRFLFNT